MLVVLNVIASPSEQIIFSKRERLGAFVRRVYPRLQSWKFRKEMTVEVRWERLE